jgi:hypothetical protein
MAKSLEIVKRSKKVLSKPAYLNIGTGKSRECYVTMIISQSSHVSFAI